MGFPLGYGSSLALGWVTGQSEGRIVHMFQLGQWGGVTRLGESSTPSPFTREGIPLTITWDKLSPAHPPCLLIYQPCCSATWLIYRYQGVRGREAEVRAVREPPLRGGCPRPHFRGWIPALGGRNDGGGGGVVGGRERGHFRGTTTMDCQRGAAPRSTLRRSSHLSGSATG